MKTETERKAVFKSDGIAVLTVFKESFVEVIQKTKTGVKVSFSSSANCMTLIPNL